MGTFAATVIDIKDELQYDQNDHLFNSVEVFAHLKVAAVTFGDNVARVEFTGSVLDSTLDAGTLLA